MSEQKKTETRLRKERIMKNVDELYEKYYNTYKSDYETDDELNEAKKKRYDRNQFKLVDKTDKELKLGEETKELKLTALPKCLRSKTDFSEATKLINNIKADTINDISKNKVKKEDAIKRMEKSIFDLEQLRQKESIVFQNKMIDVLYYLFNSFDLDKKSLLLKNKNPDELKMKTTKLCKSKQRKVQ